MFETPYIRSSVVSIFAMTTLCTHQWLLVLKCVSHSSPPFFTVALIVLISSQTKMLNLLPTILTHIPQGIVCWCLRNEVSIKGEWHTFAGYQLCLAVCIHSFEKCIATFVQMFFYWPKRLRKTIGNMDERKMILATSCSLSFANWWWANHSCDNILSLAYYWLTHKQKKKVCRMSFSKT